MKCAFIAIPVHVVHKQH